VKLIKTIYGNWYFEIDVEGGEYVMSVDYSSELEACRAAFANKIEWIAQNNVDSVAAVTKP
jgi:hypothetical protein